MALERGEAFSDARGASSAKAREQGNGRTEGGGRGSFSDSSLRARRSERRPAGGAIARRDATTHRSPRPGTCSSRWPARQSASSPSSSRRFALWERRTGGVSGGDDDARGGFGSGSRSCTPTAATRFSTARRRGMDVGGERAWAPLLVRDLHRAVLRRPARDGVCVMTRGGGGRGGQSESDFKQLLVGVPPRIGRARARRCRDRARGRTARRRVHRERQHRIERGARDRRHRERIRARIARRLVPRRARERRAKMRARSRVRTRPERLPACTSCTVQRTVEPDPVCQSACCCE